MAMPAQFAALSRFRATKHHVAIRSLPRAGRMQPRKRSGGFYRDDQRLESLEMQDVLPEGGMIRKLWVGETERYREHLLRLDSASRNNRFGGGVSDDFVNRYVDLTNTLDTIMHGFFVDRVLRGVAELRPLGTGFAREAEAALSVEKPWQSHGVGSALLSRTLLAARNRGVRLLHMACLANNERMQQLARKFDAELSFDFGSVVGEVASARATPLSVMREVVADGHGFATAMLDIQSRLLRPP
jgi:GNAT superfamily N-acetyltransferase